MGKVFTIWIVLGILACYSPAASFDIFYVSVGNTNYRRVATHGAYSFETLDGGNKSARKVAEYLNRIGAVYGILFRSDQNRFVTRGQVLDALKEVVAKTKNYPNSLIFYYFIGHGISEGIGWNHFSVPGDFVGEAKVIDVEILTEVMLYTGEIYDLLESSNSRFIMMLDNCYEGEPVSLTSDVFSETLKKNLKDIFRVLRFINEFHEPNIVLYSTNPGSKVPMTADPLNPGSNIGVGPLARRFLITVNQALHERRLLTLDDFLKQITNPALDTKTKPAVCFAELKDPSATFVGRQIYGDASKLDIRLGSGNPRDQVSSLITRPTAEEPAPSHVGNPKSSYRFVSEAGEWIGDGKTDFLTGKNIMISLEEDSTNRLVFRVEGSGEEWDIEFEAPEGKTLSKGTYNKATRSGFKEGAYAGFSASSASRGCNELVANFEICELKRDARGQLFRFIASFEQWCDSSEKMFKGSLVFRDD